MVTDSDLRDYRPITRDPYQRGLSGMKMYLTPPPTSGAVLGLILNILQGRSSCHCDQYSTYGTYGSPSLCTHSSSRSKNEPLLSSGREGGGGCGRHDEIYLIPGNILMIPTRPPPPPFKIWWGMFVEYFLLERVMFEFADKLSLFGRNRKRNKKDESSTLFALYYSPSPVWEVSFFFNVGYKLTSSAFKDKKSSVLTYHRIIEAFKFSYAWRSLLGDPYFNSDIKVGGNHSVVQIMPVFTFYQSEGSYR